MIHAPFASHVFLCLSKMDGWGSKRPVLVMGLCPLCCFAYCKPIKLANLVSSIDAYLEYH